MRCVLYVFMHINAATISVSLTLKRMFAMPRLAFLQLLRMYAINH